MSKTSKILIIIFLFLLLVLVRLFAFNYLYDPFITYFEQDYLNQAIPEFNSYKLFFHLLIRYSINTIISLAIIWVAFQNRSMIRFSIKFYFIAFLFLSFLFFVILNSDLKQGYLLAFYVRRFLIQPLFVLILLPAFYYKYLKE